MIRSQQKNRRLRRWGLACFRATLLAAILDCFHQAASNTRRALAAQEAGLSLEHIQSHFPKATALSDLSSQESWQTILDFENKPLGYVIQTSPQSDDIIGYSGASNLLITFDPEGKVNHMEVLASGDTHDHVDHIVRDDLFMTSLHGKPWDSLKDLSGIDGVSGATLTSRAMIESVIRRTGGTSPSLRFPRPLELSEAKTFFPKAQHLDSTRILDAQDNLLGYLAHTSPYADNILGYQGPTDTLIALDLDKKITGIDIHDTFETPRYTKTVRSDEYFLTLFNGKTLEEMATLDIYDAEVEGVSGATMTSMTMVEGMISMAKGLQQTSQSNPPTPAWWSRLSTADLGTIGITLLGILMSMTRLRGLRGARIVFQVALIGYLGFFNGHLLSQALFAGWASNGIPWEMAPGLVFLTAAAFLVPLFAGKQVYCHQLCPHGAAQQLLGRISPWKRALPRKLDRLMRIIPLVLIIVTILATLRSWNFNLASMEAFDAYLFPVVGISALVIAAFGLIASFFVPMAYCHYGCPTGAILNYMWMKPSQDTFNRRDGIALALLTFAMIAMP
ncbi:MAG: NosR/NirI family nitrous oxide reductase transcriptional regulator [Verrucomicrobiales bacterium]